MSKNIVICYKDQEYVCRLASYLNRKSDGTYLAYGMATVSQLEDYLKSQFVDILLLDGELSVEESLMQTKVKRRLWLTEEDLESSAESIKTFLPAKEIYTKLCAYLMAERYAGVRRQMNLEAVVFLPSEEDMENSKNVYQVSKNIAYGLAKKNHCLYWEWMPFSNYAKEESTEPEQLLYDIKKREETLFHRLSEYIINFRDVELIPAPKFCMDLRELNREDLQWFEECVVKAGYQGLIVELDFACVGDLQILTAFSKIWVCVGKESAQAMNSFGNYLSYLNVSEEKVEMISDRRGDC